MTKFFYYVLCSIFININVATTFMLNKNLIISFDFSASIWKFLNSNLFIFFLITFLNSFFSSPSGFFYLLNAHVCTLCFISISSTLRALETVNLKSRLSIGPFNFNLLLPAGLLSFLFLIKSLVACCSTNFLAKLFFLLFWFILTFDVDPVLLNCFPDLNGLFFSTRKDFLPLDVINDVSIFFLDLMKLWVFFFLYP